MNWISFSAMAVLVTVSSAGLAADTDCWVLSGQSNMQGGKNLYATGLRNLSQKKGNAASIVVTAAPGKPIEAWLDPEHRDHGLWTQLLEGIEKAKKRKEAFRGFIWYQGESNVPGHPHKYQAKLETLIKRIRDATGDPNLPVIVVQLGSATSYDEGWSLGILREAQWRAVDASSPGTVVAAADAAVGDYTVHLSKQGHELVAERIVAAAEHLAYGGSAAGWGPSPKRVTRTDDATVLHVQFDQVQGKMMLADGWRQMFGLSVNTRLPDELGAVNNVEKMGRIVTDYVHPVSGRVIDDQTVALRFAEAVPADGRLSIGATKNALSGPARRWEMELNGVRDDSGHLSICRTLLPIADGDAPAGDVPAAPHTSMPQEDWQIAINFIGRFPGGILDPDEQTGIDSWRQPRWNTASRGHVTHLFDHRGVVRPVGVETSVWYMSPLKSQPKSSREKMMSGWCSQRNWHRLSGLAPGRDYDLVLYLDAYSPKDKRQAFRLIVGRVPDDAGKDADFKRAMHHPGHPRSKATMMFDQVVREPVDEDGKNDLLPFTAATAENEWTGNVVRLSGIKAGAEGSIGIAVISSSKKMRAKPPINGLQIRPAKRP